MVSVSIFSTGCTKIVYVPEYIEAKCPRIELVAEVPRTEVLIEPGYVVKGVYLDNLLNGHRKLRNSEVYYIDTITNYNEKFAKDPIDLKE